jgi:hypothetical protein
LRDSPIVVTSENEEDKKRKSSEEHGEGNKKRKTPEVRPFHPELEAAIEGLKTNIEKGQCILYRTYATTERC